MQVKVKAKGGAVQRGMSPRAVGKMALVGSRRAHCGLSQPGALVVRRGSRREERAAGVLAAGRVAKTRLWTTRRGSTMYGDVRTGRVYVFGVVHIRTHLRRPVQCRSQCQFPPNTAHPLPSACSPRESALPCCGRVSASLFRTDSNGRRLEGCLGLQNAARGRLACALPFAAPSTLQYHPSSPYSHRCGPHIWASKNRPVAQRNRPRLSASRTSRPGSAHRSSQWLLARPGPRGGALDSRASASTPGVAVRMTDFRSPSDCRERHNC